MAATLGHLCKEVLVLAMITLSLALAEDDNFIYHGFSEANNPHLNGMGYIISNGLLILTNSSKRHETGHAFYPLPIKFNSSSSQSFSFSTTFVFATVPEYSHLVVTGMAFVIAPSMDFTNAFPFQYLGLFNISNYGSLGNHIVAVELDGIQDFEFGDIDGNHVGIDVNSLTSIQSAPAAYFSDAEGKNKSLLLSTGDPIQIWIDYSSTDKLINVTLAPITFPQKPNRPLLSTHFDLSQILLDSMYVGFSASTGLSEGDHYILGWSFNRSGPANLNISKLPDFRKRGAVKRSHIGLNILIIVLFLALVVVLCSTTGAVYYARKKKFEEVFEDWEKEYSPQRFSYQKLYQATRGFKDEERIGKGGFGDVYKGILPPSNLEIAVKRVTHNVEERMKEFVAEIVSMGRLRHRNLVQLHGYCRRKGELLLVYDYMPNKSLDKFLFGNERLNLDWFQRFQIIKGIASGLLYLHEEWEQVVIHRDIKPANVLLDADLNGKLGDFGLARLYDRGSNPENTGAAGTPPYMSPELLRNEKGTTSSDVFAFGISILEVACGRRRKYLHGLPEQEDLIDWVIDCWDRGAILDVSDPNLRGLYTGEQMELVLKLGLFCSHPNLAARPSMRQVMQYLDGDVKLPDIPPDSTVRAMFTASNEDSNVEDSSVGTISTGSIRRVGGR